MITHLFFDLDHTLWDFEANKDAVLQQVWRAYVPASPERFPEFQKSFDRHNKTLWEGFREGTVLREDLRWKRFARALLDLHIPQDKLARQMSVHFLELLPQQNLLLPHARELLAFCKSRQFPMAVITNGFEKTQWQKLEAAGIAGYFFGLFSSENCGHPKPHPEIFAQAQKESGASGPDNCLMIGDSLEADIEGAQKAGWQQVYYNPSGHIHEAKPTYEISCLSQLPQWLCDIFSGKVDSSKTTSIGS